MAHHTELHRVMRIAIISGSRADRGPLEAVRDELQGHGEFEVEWSETLKRLDQRPDIAIILGDRWETLVTASWSNHEHVPLAHISGGDITEGSQDDCFRHAITKLSHIHFPSNEDSARRIIQMGEEPWRVHMVGAPSIDRLRKNELLPRPLLMRLVMKRVTGLSEDQKCVMVSYHPNTLGDTVSELDELLAALRALDGDIGLVLIGPNHDEGWGLIDTAWKLLASDRPNTVYHPHLESQLYLSLMKHCDVMVGNSSAMIYEAPYYGTKCILLGDRQRGREFSWARYITTVEKAVILHAIEASWGDPRPSKIKDFGDGHACEHIAKVLKELPDKDRLLRKKWHPHRTMMQMGDDGIMRYVATA